MASVLSNYYIYFFSFLFLLIIIYQSIKIFKLNQRYKQLIDTIQQVENERNILLLEIRKVKLEILEKNQELESTYTALESSESLLNLSEKDLRQVQHSRDLLMEQINTLNSELSEFKQKQMSSPEKLDPSVQIISDISLLQNQFKNLYEKWEKLENKYKKGRERYTSLLKELAILEERLDIYSFGLYEPHFN